MVGLLINNKWEGYGRNLLWPNFRFYPGIFLERLRRTTKNFSRDSRFPGRRWNLGPSEYEGGVLSTDSHFRFDDVNMKIIDRSLIASGIVGLIT